MDLTDLLLADERPWAAYSACRQADGALFFPSEGDAAAEAIRICAGCAVRDECLDYALTTRARYGVWGGTTEQERRRLLRRTG